jgi:N-acetylglucosaminyldiphosphoundecaprenol N-acetyl-beta-D-mannosaminyltransferase
MINTHVNINGIYFNIYNNAEIIGIIEKNISCSLPIKIFYLNAYLFSSVIKIEELKNILNDGLIINDGIGINLFLKLLLWNKNIERTVTTDIWNRILNLSSDYHQKVIIYGGKQNRKNEILEFLKKYPGIKLIHYSDGYSNFDLSKFKADIMFVGLGSFKQELFIDSLAEKDNIPIKIAVGSAIDFWSGAKKRAPLWMQKIGLEWLYRLFQEPKRLWKRYIIGIPVFMFNIILIKVKLMLKKEST